VPKVWPASSRTLRQQNTAAIAAAAAAVANIKPSATRLLQQFARNISVLLLETQEHNHEHTTHPDTLTAAVLVLCSQVQSAPPGAYQIPGALGPQVISTKESAPGIKIGTSLRALDYEVRLSPRWSKQVH
jgi:hypothetical protein